MLSAMFFTPLESRMPLRSTPKTAGTRNTLGAVITGAPVVGELSVTGKAFTVIFRASRLGKKGQSVL